MSSAEEHFRHPAEDRALLRLTTARPAELASAIGPDLRRAYSAGLVAPDAAPPAGAAEPRGGAAELRGGGVEPGDPSAGSRGGGIDVLGPAEREAASAALSLAVAVAAEFRATPGLGVRADRLPSPASNGSAGREDASGRPRLSTAARLPSPAFDRSVGRDEATERPRPPAVERWPAPAAPGRAAAPGPVAGAHGRPTHPVRLAAVPDPGGPATPAVPVDAALWLEIGALIPEVARRRRQPGRRRRDDRAVLEGILHVLATGIGWRELPQDLGCGSGVTCWRRLREWVDGGTWAAVEPALRAALGPACGVDWDRPWSGTGRSPGAPPRTVPGDAAARSHDPGATPGAVARRLAWAGPSLV